VDLETALAVLMGGRVAEELRLGNLTTGAGNDFERATDMARKMVCEWGMSDKMGPLTFGKQEEQIFLGREIAQHRDYSEATAVQIDEEVRSFVMAAYGTARDVLEEHAEALTRLAEALLEREVLDAEQIAALVRGEELPTRSEPPGRTEPQSAPPSEEAAGATGESPEQPGVLPEPGNHPA
jgi:cell division protease FtsH